MEVYEELEEGVRVVGEEEGKRRRKIFLMGAMLIFFLVVAFLLLTGAYYWDRRTNNNNNVDLLVKNSLVYTMDKQNPIVTSFAVKDGKIVAVGGEEVEDEYGEGAGEVVDGGGRTILPGFIDSHAHIVNLGLTLIQPNLVGATSVGEVIEILQEYVDANNLTGDDWVLGRGWDQTLWDPQEYPTASDLDAAFPTLRLWLRRVDGHCGWANTPTLLASHLPSDGENPEGGEVVRDEEGNPTGIFIDTAMNFVDEVVPPPSVKELKTAIASATQICAESGITGVHDAGVPVEQLSLFTELVDEDLIPIRVYLMVEGSRVDSPYNVTLEATKELIKKGDLPILAPGYKNKVVVNSVKIYMDGALGSRGAALFDVYSDDNTTNGLQQLEQEMMTWVAEQWISMGFQVCTHCIGDRGNSVVLNAYHDAVASLGVEDKDLRLRIEHSQIIQPDDFNRFKEQKIIAAMQPTHATSDMAWAEDRLGPERIKGAYAWRTFLDHGVPLAFGSDFPVEFVDPLLGFYASVTRQDASGNPPGGWYPEQILTQEETMRAFTETAAYASFMEDYLGTLEVGKFADFILLSKNIMSPDLPPQDILQTSILETYVGGSLVYKSEGGERGEGCLKRRGERDRGDYRQPHH